MIILAFDSTAVSASAALLSDGKVTAYTLSDDGLTHSETLLPMAQELCCRAKRTLSDIDLYAVTVGPGSFTGVRIGVATVKGLAFRVEQTRNCIAVSTLEAIAEGLCPLDGIYVPVMDARRGEVYHAIFRAEGGVLTRLCPDRAVSLALLSEELMRDYPDEVIRLAGDGYDVAYRYLSGTSLRLVETPPLLRLQNAASVARCAERAYGRGEAVTDACLAPVYLRLPQAERDRLEKEKKETTTCGRTE